ncbi:MAG: tRNA epoxyqueuosine(34) reductase QueG [Spirochaetaceae bacterium]|nr:MAG: tRNA epoxyqueuosine(34) reductase QueG [Spirochaetaceae bacterium]
MSTQQPVLSALDSHLTEVFGRQGLSLLGVAAADTGSEAIRASTEYDAWIAAGYAGEMRYLQRHAPIKYRPWMLVPDCRSVLMVGLNYYRRSSAAAHQPRVARYAWGRDYHRLLGKRLQRVARSLAQRFPADRFRAFTDAVPLAERYFGRQSGIGFTGRNTLLISAEYGSWLVLGGIATTRVFSPTAPPCGSRGACPPRCRKCIEVCPTGALLGPYRIDASRCISYLTIELRGSIPPQLRPALGSWLFGCDLCQEVCPLNARARVTAEQDFLRDRAGESPPLRDILGITTDEQFRARFAGSPLARAGRQGLLRNACVVAGNTGRHDLAELLQERSRDSDAVIAEHASWTLAVLGYDTT